MNTALVWSLMVAFPAWVMPLHPLISQQIDVSPNSYQLLCLNLVLGRRLNCVLLCWVEVFDHCRETLILPWLIVYKRVKYVHKNYLKCSLKPKGVEYSPPFRIYYQWTKLAARCLRGTEKGQEGLLSQKACFSTWCQRAKLNAPAPRLLRSHSWIESGVDNEGSPIFTLAGVARWHSAMHWDTQRG